MMPQAALALLLCVASSDAWFMYKAPGGVEFNASGHRSQYLALASRTVGVKGRVVAGLSDTKLRELKKMADLHLISYAEYEKAKDGILRAMSDGTFNDG